MDALIKKTLLDQFRSYLDSFEAAPETTEAPDTETADLFTIFVELAAIRNEVRTESRLMKEALDQFRGVAFVLSLSSDRVRI